MRKRMGVNEEEVNNEIMLHYSTRQEANEIDIKLNNFLTGCEKQDHTIIYLE